jgi:hypothetical protein
MPAASSWRFTKSRSNLWRIFRTNKEGLARRARRKRKGAATVNSFVRRTGQEKLKTEPSTRTSSSTIGERLRDSSPSWDERCLLSPIDCSETDSSPAQKRSLLGGGNLDKRGHALSPASDGASPYQKSRPHQSPPPCPPCPPCETFFHYSKQQPSKPSQSTAFPAPRMAGLEPGHERLATFFSRSFVISQSF